jgi:brp/blh family beta-carotene 15,15'-monooxygenase
MKQTIFNASLEESMNLVTDQYIKTSFEDFKEKGYEGKLLGFITMQFILFLIFLFSIWIDSQNLQFLFMKVSLINGAFFGLGFVGFVGYLIDLTKIKNQSILSYYYFNKWVGFMTFLLLLQCLVIGIAGAGTIIGMILSGALYTVAFILYFIRLFQNFQKNTLEILYQESTYSNRGADFLDRFVVFAKRYGGLILFLIVIFRIFFPNSDLIQQNGTFRSIFVAINPIIFVPFLYFLYVLSVNNFQGYYLKKYLEDYRQLSDYSIEDWYGKESKRYKESLDQEV